MNRALALPLIAALSLSVSVGCASKKYVRNETAPVINKVNELDEITAKNTNAIKDVDSRAKQGIEAINAKTSEVDQKAQQAGQQAGQAQQLATQASGKVDTLTNTVANLNNYRPVAETTVHFAFDKANLTPRAKEALDQLAGEVQNAKNYIVVIDGNTDSVGPAEYNYQLSHRRADAVINYLATKYNVPAHKFYMIGLGEDKPATSNRSSKGRAENRRVDVRLMTNIAGESSPSSAQAAQPSSSQAQPR